MSAPDSGECLPTTKIENFYLLCKLKAQYFFEDWIQNI